MELLNTNRKSQVRTGTEGHRLHRSGSLAARQSHARLTTTQRDERATTAESLSGLCTSLPRRPARRGGMVQTHVPRIRSARAGRATGGRRSDPGSEIPTQVRMRMRRCTPPTAFSREEGAGRWTCAVLRALLDTATGHRFYLGG